MSRPLAALAVAAIAAAGIIVPLVLLGGDGQPRLTKDQYSRRVTAIFTVVGREVRRPAAGTEQEEISAGLRRVKESIDRAAVELETLRPPKDAQYDHDALLQSIRDYAEQVDRVRASVDFGDVGTVVVYLRAITAPAAINRAIRDLSLKGYRIPVHVSGPG